MKKIMLTTAMVTVLGTAAIAQTSITGEIRVSYKDVSMGKGALGATNIKDRNYGFGAEQQVNFRNQGKLAVGGLDYVAGFSMENDGEQTGTLFNENMYIDLTNSGTGTTLSLSRDHIQRSDSDRSAANLIGFSLNELSQTCNGTNCGTKFAASLGAAPGQAFGAALLQKTAVGTFSGLFVPNNAVRSAGTFTQTTATSATVSSTALVGVPVVNADTVGLSSSENVNPNTTAAYEIGFVGDLTIKGLEVAAFKNENNDFANTWANGAVKAKAQNYGVKYNMGQITVGANKKKHNAEAATLSETTETQYGVAFAVSKDLSVGATYAKAEVTNTAFDQKIKAVQVGYNLGAADLTVAYAKNTDATVVGNDNDIFIARLIGRF